MARASPASDPPRGPTVHNDGLETVTVLVVVRNPEGSGVTDGPGVSAETLTLSPTDTTTVDAPPSAAVEVHADGGCATAPAHTDPAFVVREGSVLVAPE